MHTYQDVSHFRAPYKNAYVSGFGTEVLTPPVTTSPPAAVDAASLIEVRGGFRRIKPEARQLVETLLMLFGTVQHGGDPEVVSLVPFTAAELQAAQQSPDAQAILMARSGFNWLRTREAEGKVVMTDDPMLQALVGQLGFSPTINLPSGHDKLYAYRKNDPALLQSKDSPVGAIILAGEPALELMPTTLVAQAGMSPVWWAVIGVAVVGGGYLLLRKRGRGGAAPRAIPSRPAAMGTI